MVRKCLQHAARWSDCDQHIKTNLEIKVGDFSGVEVVHPLKDLLDELGCLFLTQRLFLGQEVKELTPRDTGIKTLSSSCHLPLSI